VGGVGGVMEGETLGDVDDSGSPIVDNTFLLLLNCHHERIDFFAPAGPKGGSWTIVIDTNEPDLEPGSITLNQGGFVRLVCQSLMLLREENGEKG
jgi:isoamylase